MTLHPRPLSKVLVANRGEIAVRVVRACADAGLASVAVYADGDADAPHVRIADEAYPLDGATAGETYLDQRKVLDVADLAGADAVHPGYGFLAENADFAQAVIDAGLTWIGPTPQAIRDLGDKVTARQIAAAVGAPQVAGSKGPVSGADEVIAFAAEHGLAVSLHRPDLGPGHLPTRGSFDLLVVMGSIESVYDDTVDWIGPERALVSTAVADPATSLRAAPPISVSPPTALPIRTEMFCART